MPEPVANNVKQTPGRRRPSHNATRGSARRNYASENDAATADPSFRPDFSTRGNRGPSTPKKPAPAASGPQSNSKPHKRSANKSYPKNISTSPGPAKPGRRTPPQTAGAKTPGASTAFAGATFHASPAPSSLPLPSFFTKMSPGTPQIKTASGLSQEPSPPASDSETQAAVASPRQVVPTANGGSGIGSGTPSVPSGTESQLDFLFRADRAEKERTRRASSANIFNTPNGALSPPAQMSSIYGGYNHSGSNTFPKMPAHQLPRHPGSMQRIPGSGISSAELDGTPGRPIGPAFATPFQERMRAARSNEGRHTASVRADGFGTMPTIPAMPAMSTGAPFSATQRYSVDERTEALKKFLFSKPTVTAASPESPGSARQPLSPLAPPVAAREVPVQPKNPVNLANPATSPFQNIYATPVVNGGGASSLTAMEISLRQLLKIDSSSGVSHRQ